MKRKTNKKPILFLVLGLMTVALIAAVIFIGGDTTPPADGPPETGESSPSPGITIPTPDMPIPSTPDIDPVDPEPSTGPNTPPDFILDVSGNPSKVGNRPNDNPVQPDAMPLEPIAPPSNPPFDTVPTEDEPDDNTVQTPAEPMEPTQTEPDSGGEFVIGGDQDHNLYNCHTPKHNCDTPEKHAFITNLEIDGCPVCGSHSCPSFYALNPWGFTHYTPSKCPEYDKRKDPVYTCQDCGKPTGDGTNGTCARFVNAANCPNCGEYVPAWTCHFCK